MLNSLASYLWGSSEVEQSYSEAAQTGSEVTVDEEQLTTRQEDEWIVVASRAGIPECPAGTATTTEEGTEGGDTTVREEGSAAMERSTPARPRPLHTAAAHNYNILNASPRRLLQSVYKAEAAKHLRDTKNISRQHCGRENQVHLKLGSNRGHNKHNKRVRPSGFKASRISQRM